MKVPTHVAIIMDGNGRWARERGLPRSEGHRRGVNALKKIVKTCDNLNIACLTVYAFSTENWKRPEDEVNFLMGLLKRTLKNEADELNQNNVKINILGRREELPAYLAKEIEELEELTSSNQGLELNIALNYGGRSEIIDTMKEAIKHNRVEDIDEDIFKKYLYCSHFPEVELLIRTGGEKRISNFLLWEIAYAEFYFTDKYWPDFNEDDFVQAINDFQQRDRRFGGIENDA